MQVFNKDYFIDMGVNPLGYYVNFGPGGGGGGLMGAVNKHLWFAYCSTWYEYSGKDFVAYRGF